MIISSHLLRPYFTNLHRTKSEAGIRSLMFLHNAHFPVTLIFIMVLLFRFRSDPPSSFIFQYLFAFMILAKLKSVTVPLEILNIHFAIVSFKTVYGFYCLIKAKLKFFWLSFYFWSMDLFEQVPNSKFTAILSIFQP
jgi:hypothetical protein